MSQSEADEVLATMVAAGINHLDTARAYADSELRLAPLLADRRSDFFLATKTGERSGPEARAGLEESLERMGVDGVDLIQLHNLVEEDDWQRAFSAGGAVEALFAARDEGLCHHVGVTGHGLRIARMHMRSIEEAPMASVLLPWNHSLAAIDHYRADFEELVDSCTERGIAVQTIKSVARRRWLVGEEPRSSWYEPITDAGALERAVKFVLADDRLFLNSSSDASLLQPIIDAASRDDSSPPEPAALANDRARLDITPLFDGADLEVI